ncbi:putative poly(A)+ RNA transport protein (UbaA) [Trypanosoma conorhini]|uniref:Putative poly(A)+ RNA transport protein (UbaA) n=1 Tax=Trypanosoma conorhini TaxID=83891 RepID=A0A3R7LGA8_9TRYP|nr:putative poly(A)+ RNA transport protein (UbaA) [Trypanosoma conorhini]RNF23162.1 putative poly(A)+ RNA transport protein (UbaA) [Trypanosoma conorhini]
MSHEEEKRQLYNRQEYVVGAETQAKYGSTDVLVVGACGLGAELVKNLALTGVRSIKVMDDGAATLQDLGTNFFLTPQDVGKPRAGVVAARAQELNRFVSVTAVTRPLHEVLPTVHVVVFANQRTTALSGENALARRHGVKFVACESRGIVGCVFVDAGPSFSVLDPDGEETVSCIVTSISRDGVVSLHEDKNHECEVGSHIFFTGVVSPAAVNADIDPSALHGRCHSAASSSLNLFEVAEVISPYILRLKNFEAVVGDDPIDVGTAAYLHTTKRHVLMGFKDLEQSVADPAFITVFDSEHKLNAPATLHAVFRALHDHGTLPSTPAEVKSVLTAAEAYYSSCNSGHLDAAAAKSVLSVIHGNLNPMACFIGGIASQEVLKVCSGKFTPIQQWLYYDARELLVARGEVTEADLRPPTPTGSRYDQQIAVLGAEFQSYLSTQWAFIIGAGALGCELIKNAACMGLGGISITDMDNVEMSNLSRQFLFRNSHIGQHKSKVAGEAARAINHDLQVNSFVEKVSAETEGIFNERFWDSHAVVLNALDNVESRKYVDSRCLFYRKALFESGTLGTKCNVQCIIPYCTESYSSSHDPPEKSIPLCTLKNFPNAIEHTIQWARDNFHVLFTSTPEEVNAYLQDPVVFAAELERDPANKTLSLKAVRDALVRWPADAADCVRIARRLHHEYFNDAFRQLLYNIPVDKRNDNGELFWSGAKKPPTPQEFAPDSEWSVSFVYHCAYLLACVYGLPPFMLSREEVVRLAQETAVPAFVPRQAVFATSETEKEEPVAQLAADVRLQDLPPVGNFHGRRMFPLLFEKDDPTNHHVEYITACSNMRAVAYSIPPAGVHHTKRVAGNIIPAMLTTTALVTGLVGLELLKRLLLTWRWEKSGRPANAVPAQDEIKEQLSIYRNSFVNLALPFFAFSDPIMAPGSSYMMPDGQSVRWSIWDRIDVNEGRDLTVQELVSALESRYQVELFIIALASGKMIYSQFGNTKDRGRPVSAVVQERGEQLQDGEDCCCLIATGSMGDVDVDIPVIRYRFRNF